MITITIEPIELYDSEREVFVYVDGGTFRFEHSLDAITKWESLWRTSFFDAFSVETKLQNGYLESYCMMMCLDDGLLDIHLTPTVLTKLAMYMSEQPTATIFNEFQNGDKTPSRGKVLTSEEVYAMMVMANVPFEASSWNIHRLMVLLKIISIKSGPQKKMTKQEILQQQARINKERREKYNSKG